MKRNETNTTFDFDQLFVPLGGSTENAPKWMNKAKRAVFTITTYGKDGNKLATSTGFFISETGEAVSAYNIFKGAEKATITDFEGKHFWLRISWVQTNCMTL